MQVGDLTFKTYANQGKPAKAAQVSELMTVATVDGVLAAHPGDYVVVVGQVERHGWVPPGDGKAPPSVHDAPPAVSEDAYAIVPAAEFESVYVVEQAAAAE